MIKSGRLHLTLFQRLFMLKQNNLGENIHTHHEGTANNTGYESWIFNMFLVGGFNPFEKY